MERLATKLKRGIRRLPRLVIAFVGLIIALAASIVAFPVYLFSPREEKEEE